MTDNCRCGRRLVRNERLMELVCLKCWYPSEDCRCAVVKETVTAKNSPSPKQKWASRSRIVMKGMQQHAAKLGGRAVSLNQIRYYKKKR